MNTKLPPVVSQKENRAKNFMKAVPLICVLGFAQSLHGAAITYDGNLSSTGAQDGNGAGWNTTNTNFWDGTAGANVKWTNSLTDTAVFGAGGAGSSAITVGAVTANSIVFNQMSSIYAYTLASGTITLGGVSPTITVNNSNGGTITSALAGTSGFTKSGVGGLSIGSGGSANLAQLSGTVNISAGSVFLGADGSGQTWYLSSASSVLGISVTGTIALGELKGVQGSTLRASGSYVPIISIGGMNTDFTYDGKITGNVSIVKTGTGTMTLTGMGSNSSSYTGTTTVQNGTLVISSVAAGTTATQSLGKGMTVNLGAAAASSGILKYVGAAGTLDKNINVLGNGGDTIQNAGTGALTLTGTITKANTKLTLNGGTSGIVVTGLITGGTPSDFNSDLNIVGGLITLSTANSYTGPTSIYNGGTLKNGIQNAIPTGSVLNLGNATDAVGATNTYDLNGFNQTIAALNSFSNSGATNVNTITNGAANGTTTLTLSGVNSDSVAANSSFSGGIKDGTNAKIAVTVSGGSHVLSGVNTYTGLTTLSSGTLQIGNGGNTGSLSASSEIVDNGLFVVDRSDVVTQGVDFSGSAITGTGGFTQAGSGTTVLNAANTYTGLTTISAGALKVNGSLAAASSVNIATTGTLSGTGTINGKVVAQGAISGSLALKNDVSIGATGSMSGANTFGGNIALNNAVISNVSSNIEIASGKVLSGSGGTIGAVTADSGAIVAPGGTNTLTLGSLTLAAGSHLELNVNSATSYGSIVTTANNGLSLGGDLILTIDLGYTPGSDQLTLILNEGSGKVDSVFSDIVINGTDTHASAQGAVFEINGKEFAISYTAGDGNDVALIAVPEPSTWAIFAGGLGLLLLGQRAKRIAVRV